MSTIVLEAETRLDTGKGASRRLRRLENKIPGVIYGGDQPPQTVSFAQNKITKALENVSIYSSIFDLLLDGKIEKVLLKDMQRHPYKPIVLHMDLQRVAAKDILVKQVPIHFTNEQTCKGVKAGGMINHTMTQVEIRCQASKLPEFIEVDMAQIGLNEVIHLSNLRIPEGVELTADVTDHSHDLPVVSVHVPKQQSVEDEAPTAKEVPSATGNSTE